MPTFPGGRPAGDRPRQASPAVTSHNPLSVVVDWVGHDMGHGIGYAPDHAALTRGMPTPLAWWQLRKIRGPGTRPKPVPSFFYSQPYDRGAQAYAPQFGIVPINPIGAGIYAPYRQPTIAGPGARYAAGAIWFDVQSVPTSLRMGPGMRQETIEALIQTSYAAAAYAGS